MGKVIPFPDRFSETGNRWEPWATERSVAKHFGVTERTVRNWRLEGMPSARIGGSRRYRISECEQWHAGRAS